MWMWFWIVGVALVAVGLLALAWWTSGRTTKAAGNTDARYTSRGEQMAASTPYNSNGFGSP